MKAQHVAKITVCTVISSHGLIILLFLDQVANSEQHLSMLCKLYASACWNWYANKHQMAYAVRSHITLKANIILDFLHYMPGSHVVSGLYPDQHASG
jgi:threonine/homoserine efflux transporter RhtA